MAESNRLFKIKIPKSVEKELDNLPNQILKNILKHLNTLSQNPYPQDSKKLKKREGFRIRVDDYRIIYDVNINDSVIIIRRIAHRKDVYR